MMTTGGGQQSTSTSYNVGAITPIAEIGSVLFTWSNPAAFNASTMKYQVLVSYNGGAYAIVTAGDFSAPTLPQIRHEFES